jgi:hypothetical protein
MTGLLLRLAERTLGLAPSVRPFAPRFAPEPRVGSMETGAPLAIGSARRGPAPGVIHSEPLAPPIERVVIERPVPTPAPGSAAAEPPIERVVIERPVPTSAPGSAAAIDPPVAPAEPPLVAPIAGPAEPRFSGPRAPDSPRAPDPPRAPGVPPEIDVQLMNRLLVPASAPVARLEASDPAPGATRVPWEPGSRDHDAVRGPARVAASSADVPRASAPPPIRVTIGRVDVRAVVPAPQARRAAVPATPPPVSLDEYLRRRDRGDR